jgi:hypothetical protein
MTQPKSGRPIQSTLVNDGKLDILIRHAMAKFKALSPEEQAAHRREQAISWVYGEMGLAGHTEVTKEEIADVIDRVRRDEP